MSSPIINNVSRHQNEPNINYATLLESSLNTVLIIARSPVRVDNNVNIIDVRNSLLCKQVSSRTGSEK